MDEHERKEIELGEQWQRVAHLPEAAELLRRAVDRWPDELCEALLTAIERRKKGARPGSSQDAGKG